MGGDMQFIWLILSIIFYSNIAFSAFHSNYLCTDTEIICRKGPETKWVEGVQIYRDCWEYSYKKTCNYPSKDDCSKYAHCYALGQVDCLLKDSLGNCVNPKMEFSCHRWDPICLESERLKYGLNEKEGMKQFMCEKIPCIDGNCLDKSYVMDGDMASSISLLKSMAAAVPENGGANFSIFKSIPLQCSKKAMSYHNCCKISPSGWGKSLGAKCSDGEKALSHKRSENLCIEAGSEPIKGPMGKSIGRKYFFCCFSNVIEKAVQIQGREQLRRKGFPNLNWETSNCRGLTLEELMEVDFDEIDFGEVAADFNKKMFYPNLEDIQSRVTRSIGNVNKFNMDNPQDPENMKAGMILNNEGDE